MTDSIAFHGRSRPSSIKTLITVFLPPSTLTNIHHNINVDEDGLNGHTPLFHTVNSIHNRSEPVLRLLLAAGARPDVRLAGLTWGKGYEWETTFFDVTPISYAQMGLMPQVHRRESDIYANIRSLLESSGRRVPSLRNVPNRYLRPK